MQHNNRWMVVIVMILAVLFLLGCSQAEEETAEEENEAVQVEHLEGPNPSRIVLSEDAAQLLDIQTALVHEEQVNGTQRTVLPYAAVLYDPEGNTWAYIESEPLTFVRQPIDVDRIEGDLAVLLDGPASGAEVVTIGATELYGSEEEFEEE